MSAIKLFVWNIWNHLCANERVMLYRIISVKYKYLKLFTCVFELNYWYFTLNGTI